MEQRHKLGWCIEKGNNKRVVNNLNVSLCVCVIVSIFTLLERFLDIECIFLCVRCSIDIVFFGKNVVVIV